MAKFEDLPQELVTKILSYVIEVTLDSKARMLSPKALDIARLVCKQWKDTVDPIRSKSLIATPTLAPRPQNRTDEDRSILPDIDWIDNIIAKQENFDTVSFSYGPIPGIQDSIEDHLYDPIFAWQQHVACKLMPALSKAKAVHLGFGFWPDTTPRTSPVPSFSKGPRIFSWISQHVGIQGNLPEQDGFPWRTLRLDFPWDQLTHVDLECPLSLDDTHYVLQCSSATLQVGRFVGLTNDTALDQENAPLCRQSQFAVPNLMSLEIHADLHLDDLLSTMTLEALKHYTLKVAIPGSGSLDRPIYHPWETLTEVDIRCPLTVMDAYHILTRNLTAARLGSICAESAEIENQNVKYLEDLTSLTVESDVDLHGLFSKLSFTKEPDPRDTNRKRPALRSLSLTLNSSDGYSLDLDLRLNVPWEELQCLEIRYHAAKECDVSPILANCRQLKHLSLASSPQPPTLTLQSDFDCPLTEIELGDGFPSADFLPRFSPLSKLPALNAAKFAVLSTSSIKTFQGLGEFTFPRHFAASHLSVGETISLSMLVDLLRQLCSCLISGSFRVHACDLNSELTGIQPINMLNLKLLSLAFDDPKTLPFLKEFLTAGVIISRDYLYEVREYENRVDWHNLTTKSQI